MITKETTTKHNKEKDSNINTSLSGRYSISPIPRLTLPQKGAPAQAAYQIIHNELQLDGKPELNLSSFVTTWMEPEVEKLMVENLDKNFIDHFQYPQSQIIEARCVNILANLFNAPEATNYAGTATIGSSEAIMLGLLAHKWKWKARREKEGKSTAKPNLIIGAEVHVCWNKFARYFDVEARIVPMDKDNYTISAADVEKLIDENTICVGCVVGTTYTGQLDPVGDINDLLTKINKEKGWDIGIHVDAASGGFVMPFAYPDVKWDFRYERVRSINTSGHKYGLVYPGIGWLIFRDVSDLPEDIIFYVNYLGQTESSYTLNFSKPATGILGQYYNFIRLGNDGYTAVMKSILENAQYLANRIVENDNFKLLGAKTILPIVTFQLKGGEPFTVFDVSYAMRQKGWIVSAYNLPANAESVYMLRVVVRETFTHDMAASFMKDIHEVYTTLHAEGKKAKKKPLAPGKKEKSSVNVC